MTESTEFVEIDVARTPFEAQIVTAVLQDAGIPAFINGGSLQDEVAVSRALMNVAGVRITVPSDRVDEAYRAIEESRHGAAERLAAEAGSSDDAPPARSE